MDVIICIEIIQSGKPYSLANVWLTNLITGQSHFVKGKVTVFFLLMRASFKLASLIGS